MTDVNPEWRSFIEPLEPMTPDAALAELKRIRAMQDSDDDSDESGDVAEHHRIADETLCRVLLHFGLDELVEEWNRIYKWVS